MRRGEEKERGERKGSNSKRSKKYHNQLGFYGEFTDLFRNIVKIYGQNVAFRVDPTLFPSVR